MNKMLPLTNSATEFATIDTGHHPIENKEIWSVALLQNLPSLESVRSGDHSITPDRQSMLKNSTTDRVVFRDPDSIRGPLVEFAFGTKNSSLRVVIHAELSKSCCLSMAGWDGSGA